MKSRYQGVLFFSLCALSTLTHAGVWEERAHLERYKKQLEALNETVLVQAADSSDPKARIAMNYNELLHDAREIVNKIEHHLETPLEEYRSPNVSVENDLKTSTEH